MTALPCALVLAALALPQAAARDRTRPPAEKGPFRATDLVEVTALDPTVRLDVRYATPDNFMKRVLYSQARVFLQRPAAEAVVRAHRRLRAQGFGLLLFDGYRPWRVTKMMWDATPPAQRDFVANPAVGSKHNRGCAVDLSMYDLGSGREVEMPSAYDEFSARADPSYAGGTAGQRERRDLLRRAMEAEGFTVEPNEWWHFNCRDWRAYPIVDIPFEDLPPPAR
jgi:D-alanyl-D-alanine dipeptidase